MRTMHPVSATSTVFACFLRLIRAIKFLNYALIILRKSAALRRIKFMLMLLWLKSIMFQIYSLLMTNVLRKSHVTTLSRKMVGRNRLEIHDIIISMKCLIFRRRWKSFWKGNMLLTSSPITHLLIILYPTS